MKKSRIIVLCLLAASLTSACSPFPLLPKINKEILEDVSKTIPKDNPKESSKNNTKEKTKDKPKDVPNKSAQNGKTDLDDFVNTAKTALGVPDNLPVTYTVGDPSYWDAACIYIRFVQFCWNDIPVASAFCDATTGEPARSILSYTPPEPDWFDDDTPTPKTSPDTSKSKSPAVRSNPKYKTYRNSRFGFEIDFPDFLNANPEPDNGSGRTFTSSDHTITLYTYGSHDVFMYDGIKGLYEARLSEAEFPVSYKVQKDNWCVISGALDTMVYYQKCIYKSDGTINEFLIIYPESTEKTMDSVVTRLYSSFNSGIGIDSAVSQ